MTIQDIYTWAKNWHIEDYTLLVTNNKSDEPVKYFDTYVHDEDKTISIVPL